MIGESAQAILARRSQQAEANRKAMPFTSTIVDELRADGFQPSVKFAEENGKTVGTPSPQGVVPVLARKSDPDTSKAAAEKVDAFKAKHEALIFDAIFHAGPRGCTYKEIAKATRLEPVKVARRLSGMADRGLIIRKASTDGNGFHSRDGCAAWWAA